MKNAVSEIVFAPVIDPVWLWFIGCVGLIVILTSFYAHPRGFFHRSLCFVLFFLFLLNPSLVKEERDYVKDVGVIVVDQSYSQTLQDRTHATEKVLDYLKSALAQQDFIDYRVIHAPIDKNLTTRTDLFVTLDQALTDIPKKRRAGVVFLSDGRVHDVPSNEAFFDRYGPVHAILTGRKDEKDRRLKVINAPAYGLVGQDISIRFQVEDTKNIGARQARVTLTLSDGTIEDHIVPVGKDYEVGVPISNPSQNIFMLKVEHVDDELTYTNNKTAVIVNGVRDRLKVLLVSGVPHSGERTWRDLLTSDPGVDLVHFTILREPDKYDYTPQDELSLIAFPFRELFEVKLYDFDLIIFDRYRVNNILPKRYFKNIAEYVRKGGAFLQSSGPAFADNQSVYDTPLGEILPARPTGEVIERGYYPFVTDLGQYHPVTSGLTMQNDETNPKPTWGKWLRYIDVEAMRGDVLMNAMDNKPLLILDRVKQGRVAQLSSDHIWLWSRGYDGGGPHAELLRRSVHWLMKEPELDDRAITIKVSDYNITVQKRPIGNVSSETMAMTLPDGRMETVDLVLNSQGMLEYKHQAGLVGIYSFEDVHGARKSTMVGDLTALELNGVTTTPDILKPIIETSRGTYIWHEDHPAPALRFLNNSRQYGGSNWIGFKRNNDFIVTGVERTPLLPAWLGLLILFSTLIYTWFFEGRVREK